MGILQRSGVCALALLAGSAALQFEPAAFRDLAFENGDQRLTVGAVRVPLWSAAFAQSSDSFTIENLSFTWGPFTYEAKRLDFSGATVSRADIQGLFSPASEPMASRLARIRAKKVTAPEMKVTQKLGKETQTIHYRNVSLNDIAQGRIASVAIEATAIEETSATGSIDYSYGRTTMSDLDMPAFAKLYETKDETASTPLARIYGSFSIDNIDAVDNGEDYAIKIDRISGRDFMARPTRDSWAGTMTLLMELADKDDTTSEDDARLATGVADLLGAIDMGFVEATGIEIKTEQSKKDSGAVARINRMAYTGGSGSQSSDTRAEGIEITDKDSRVKIETVSLTGFSITPTLNALKDLQGKPLENLDAATIRSLLPTLGTLRLSGLDIDALSEGDEGKDSERVRVTTEEFAITADKPVNGIPTNIRIEQRNASMTLPPNSQDDLIRELRALGYTTLDGSFLAAARWNEATNEIVLDEVSTEWRDMGRISLTGLIGNAGKDLFSPDEATAAAAFIGAKAKSLDIVVENQGLFERYLAQTAKEQKTTPEALRREYASAAAIVMPGLVGNSEQAQGLSKAIARFIAQPGKLTVNVQPKNPSGFGVMDAMLASEPAKILEKLNITAKAE